MLFFLVGLFLHSFHDALFLGVPFRSLISLGHIWLFSNLWGSFFSSAEYLFWGISIVFFLPERLFKLSVIFSALQGSFLFWVLLFRTFSWAFCPAIFLSGSVHFRTLQNTSFLWILWGSSTQLFFMVVLFLQHFIWLPFVPSTDLDALFFSPLLLLQPEPTLPFCGSVLCRPHFTFDISCCFFCDGGGMGAEGFVLSLPPSWSSSSRFCYFKHVIIGSLSLSVCLFLSLNVLFCIAIVFVM